MSEKIDPFATEESPRQEVVIPSATVRWRIKGNADGPVYSGQQMIKGCRTCGKPVDHRSLTTSGVSPGCSEVLATN